MRTLPEQAERLVDLGAHELAGLTAADLRAAVAGHDATGAVLVLRTAPASALAPLLEHAGRPGFVVTDMTDADEFAPIDGIDLPDGPAYLLREPDRGDAPKLGWCWAGNRHTWLGFASAAGRAPVS
jgi:hypothetical protein